MILSIIRANLDAGGDQSSGDRELTQAPTLSDDGTRVAFHSVAPDLVPGDANGLYDVFVKDLSTGGIARASAGADGAYAGLYPILSADGTEVAFRSASGGLVPGDDNGVDDVFVRDLEGGGIVRIQRSGETGSHDLSADGTRAAIQAQDGQIYVEDLASGRLFPVGIEAEPPSESAGFAPAISADGALVAFEGVTYETEEGGENGAAVYLKDVASGEVTQVLMGTSNFRLSADGTRLAFTGEVEGRSGVFVRDLATGKVVPVATSAEGSFFVTDVSADGNRVIFDSDASGLVPGDANGRGDVFVKDLTTGALWRVNTALGGAEADGASSGGTLSADGRVAAFSSQAGNLVPGDTNGAFDTFVVRLPEPAGTTLVGTGSGDDLGGGAGGDTLVGAAGNDVLRGLGGADRLFGGRDPDLLAGGPGRDFLDGGDGADLLYGGAGRDVLVGGNDPDVFLTGAGDAVRDLDRSEGDEIIRLDPGMLAAVESWFA